MRTPNRDILMGKWKQLKGQVRKEWGKLTDNQVAQIGGTYERLVGVLQERYGHVRQDTRQEANRWMGRKSGNDRRHP